jgi:hypothetical protein
MTEYQIALGDLDLESIAELKAQYRQNVEVLMENAAFFAACELVEPVLESHPGWKWRDAAKWLIDNGRIPGGAHHKPSKEKLIDIVTREIFASPALTEQASRRAFEYWVRDLIRPCP